MSLKDEISNIIKNKITENVRYFPNLEGSKDLSKNIASFSNTETGFLIFGVANILDDLEVNGFARDYYIGRILDKSLESLNVIPEFQSEDFYYQGKRIFAMKIIKSEATILVDNVEYIMENNEIKKKDEGRIIVDKSRVFIVHGHDDLAKVETARFIEKLGLEAIILHERASGGDTIIEKIIRYSNVGFGIVLYTPCDEGRSKDSEELKYRARQNVIFEHGYLMGKIGRDKVCALVKGEIEKPNDISGVVYITMDNSGSWRNELFSELKNAGYDLDANVLYK